MFNPLIKINIHIDTIIYLVIITRVILYIEQYFVH